MQKKIFYLIVFFILTGCCSNKERQDQIFAQHIQASKVFFSLGEFDKALEKAEEALKVYPDYTEAYTCRAAAKTGLKNYKGAIEDFTKAIELNPKNSYAFYHRGYAKYCLDDREGAVEDLNKSGELGFTEAYEMIKNIKK